MKSKILKLSCFAILLFTFFGCNDCSECEKENKDLKEKLEICISNQENSKSNDNSLAKSSLKKYQVKGGFSTKANTIDVCIPVTDRNLSVAEPPVDISSSKCNAILIRVDNNSEGCTSQQLPYHFINEKILISKINSLNTNRLKEDNKLIVIVIKCSDLEFPDFISSYKNSIVNLNGDYTSLNTILTNGCIKIKDITKPNEDGGDIIVGG
ncbi:hypothetical protein WNY78_16870 [Psychroserpens sp. AS72]|uniref:hypothetical protein n=1 Tax=Psychroserpens sp. AS72 TaxID=3135775 RepID=UPI0031774E50